MFVLQSSDSKSYRVDYVDPGFVHCETLSERLLTHYDKVLLRWNLIKNQRECDLIDLSRFSKYGFREENWT